MAAADVVFLNAVRRKLQNPDVEQQYVTWRGGLTKDEEVGVGFGVNDGRTQASFEARICGQSLSVFQRPNVNYGETADEMTTDGISPGFSREDLNP